MPDPPPHPVELFPRRSRALSLVRHFIARAAAVDVAVLLEGETGTGKTLIARHIHHASARREQPFVAINCAGIPAALFESELFGHVRGAFTGAHQDHDGLMVAAGRGSLLLDEIGELAPEVQGKLLAAVEDTVVRPVGSARERPVAFRLISATCRDLRREVDEGRFRRDLFHRIALLRIVVPPLRDRPHDILPLARRFLQAATRRHGLEDRAFGTDALEWMAAQSWPGNLRELAHTVEAAAILAPSPVIRVSTLEEGRGGDR